MIQGGGTLCASLDVAGAPVHITNPDAGTLTATATNVSLEGGSAMISATPNGDANVPSGYSTLFVLTQGEGLVIEQVSGTPEFTVKEAGTHDSYFSLPNRFRLKCCRIGSYHRF